MGHREEVHLGYWKERQLVEQVRALRRLPPDTWLPTPAHQPDRDLLAGLLDVGNTDPLRWIEERHAELAARVLLWIALDRIRSLVRGVRLAGLAGHGIPANEYRPLLANLLDLPEDAEPFRLLADTHPTTASPELLRSVFQAFHALHQGTPPAAYVGGDEHLPIEPLLASLLQLPKTADPLQWIQDEHSHVAAVATLSHILNQVRPPHSMLLGPEMKLEEPLRVLHPNVRLRAEGLSLVLRKVILGKTSFTLSLNARIPERMLRIPFGSGRRIEWVGIARVVDNLGHQYVVWDHLHEGQTRWRAYNMTLLLVCYPAIALADNEITLSSDHTAVVVTERQTGEQPRRISQQILLGDLTWRVGIAK